MRLTATGLATILFSQVACGSNPEPQLLASVCHGGVVDTATWYRDSFHGGSVLVPHDFERDTSVAAQVAFYHGGGRWLGTDKSLTYGYINPDVWPGLPPDFDTLPGEPACWPQPTGWLARVSATWSMSRYEVVGWYRREESPLHWLTLHARAVDSTTAGELFTMVASVRPDSIFWADVD